MGRGLTPETTHTRVWSVGFSPDGKTLASAPWGVPVRLRDVPAAEHADK
jgi:hypothetical protein